MIMMDFFVVVFVWCQPPESLFERNAGEEKNSCNSSKVGSTSTGKCVSPLWNQPRTSDMGKSSEMSLLRAAWTSPPALTRQSCDLVSKYGNGYLEVAAVKEDGEMQVVMFCQGGVGGIRALSSFHSDFFSHLSGFLCWGSQRQSTPPTPVPSLPRELLL